MKQQADKRRSDRSFDVGDLVYVKLQPYRQTIVVNHKYLKLLVRYFGPCQIIGKVGEVAYKLDLLEESKIHPVFHVSQLKRHVSLPTTQFPLPLLDASGLLSKEPISILDRCIVRKGNTAVTKVLVQWRNTILEDATWKVFSALSQ